MLIARSALLTPMPTVVDPDCVHEPLVSVTLNVTGDVPAENTIEEVPLPEVIVPFVIDQEYVVPAGPAGTDAALPVELAATDEGAVIVSAARLDTVTVCDTLAEQPFASVTCTE